MEQNRFSTLYCCQYQWLCKEIPFFLGFLISSNMKLTLSLFSPCFCCCIASTQVCLFVSLKLCFLNKLYQLKLQKNPEPDTVTFNSMFSNTAMFYGTFSSKKTGRFPVLPGRLTCLFFSSSYSSPDKCERLF